MEKAMKYLMVMALFSALFISCDKEEKKDEEEEFIPLSYEAKQWLKDVKSSVVYFKSNTGLSDSYTISNGYSFHSYSSREFVVFRYRSNMSDFNFDIGVLNGAHKEQVAFYYSTYIKNYFSYMDFGLSIDTPYRLLRMYYDPKDLSVMAVSGFISVKDTTIGQTLYTDLFKVNIDHRYNRDSAAINNLYISKSKGLVAFRVQKNIIWYRNE